MTLHTPVADVPRGTLGERWKLFLNTSLQVPRWFFDLVITDRAYDRVLHGDERLGPYSPTTARRSPRAVLRRVRNRLVRATWFWPRITDAFLWSVADEKSNWAPEKYLRSEPRRLLEAVMEAAPKQYRILDLGCNSGSDLNILATRGWRTLSGVDAGSAALALFEDKYPETYRNSDIRHDLFQRFLANAKSGAFDLVYSNGATIELVHPSFPIVAELCRISQHTVLLDIAERGAPYPRDYQRQFEQAGFRLVSAVRPLDCRRDFSLLRFDRARDV